MWVQRWLPLLALGLATVLAARGAAGQAAAAHHPTLDRSVLHLLDSAEPLRTAERLGYHLRDDRVQVMVVAHDAAGAAALADWLQTRHAHHLSVVRTRVQAHVDIATLRALGDHPAVRWVRRPLYAEIPRLPIAPGCKEGQATTQGLAAMNGPAWHTAGSRGQGIKVGVIDTGWGGYQALVGSDLPPWSRLSTRAFGAWVLDPDNGHGTRSAEVIHDIVPDAHLYLAMIETIDDLLAALEWLRDEGVQVVAEMAAYAFCGPGDGTGPFLFPELAELTTEHGMLFVTGAGNYREQHWQGASTDSDSDGWVELAGTDERMSLVESDGTPTRFASGDTITAYLVWNDWATKSQDYALYLFRANGSAWTQVAVADDSQNGAEDHWPAEALHFRVESAGTYALGIRRNRVEGTNDLELFTPRTASLEHLVSAGSLLTPADSPHIIAAGAARHHYPYTYFSFSSQGPTNGPGGSLAGGTIKPDISGYAEVDTVNHGPSGFSGTSAACPHVVGAAALLWSTRPSWSNLEIRRFLAATAMDMGPTGKDNDYGAGRLHLGDPIPAMNQCAVEVSPTEDSFPDDGGAGVLSVTVASGCPWFAATHEEWIHVNGGEPNGGSGTVRYTIDRNRTGDPRQGALLVAGTTVTVGQEAGILMPAPRRPRTRY